MNTPGRTQLTSFLAGAGAIGIAGVLTRACPGGCTSCATCATALIPMGVSATAVGAAFLGSAAARARRGSSDRADATTDAPKDRDPV